MELDRNYWSNRYRESQTQWDTGSISTPIKEYIDSLNDKSIRILIPGAGNSYEAEYLFRSGFTNVTVLDIAAEPLNNLQQRIPDFPVNQLLLEDYFNHQGQYDLLLEQTFFCAINPGLRKVYAQKAAELLKKGGLLSGVLFIREFAGGPPFGGNTAEYIPYFKDLFRFRVFEPCTNSIPPRMGSELFMILEKI